jgi:hypothetical protein
MRISLRQTARSNRSIGRLPRVNVFAQGANGRRAGVASGL